MHKTRISKIIFKSESSFSSFASKIKSSQILFCVILIWLSACAKPAVVEVTLPEDIVFVSPDAGGIDRTRGLAKKINADLAIIDKRRPQAGKSQVMNIIGEVKNKDCLIVDDIIDTGGTIVNAAEALIKKGAKDVYVFVTHAVLSGEAINKIKKSKIKKLVTTDSIDNSRRIKNISKIQVLSIAPLMAEAIKRISNSTSVSDLFN